MLISKAVEVSGIAVALFGRYWIKACRKMLEPVSATPLQCVSCEANRVFSWIFHSRNFSKVITVSTKYHDSIVLDVAKHLVGLERLLRCILKPCLPGPNQENPLHTQLLILPQFPPLPTTLRKTWYLSCFYLDRRTYHHCRDLQRRSSHTAGLEVDVKEAERNGS